LPSPRPVSTELGKQSALEYCRTKRLDLEAWLSALAPPVGPVIKK
jgi:hypothetical protein